MTYSTQKQLHMKNQSAYLIIQSQIGNKAWLAEIIYNHLVINNKGQNNIMYQSKIKNKINLLLSYSHHADSWNWHCTHKTFQHVCQGSNTVNIQTNNTEIYKVWMDQRCLTVSYYRWADVCVIDNFS